MLRKRDATGSALVDSIVDEAEQKGTGRWAVQSALDLGVPLTTITEAVFARALSARRAQRLEAEKLLAHAAPKPRKPSQADIDAIRDGLYASKIVAYAQGFEEMAVASKEFGWDLKLGELAMIWRGGCIIRARLLHLIREAYEQDADGAEPAAAAVLPRRGGEGRAELAEDGRRSRWKTACRSRRSPRRSPITTACGAGGARQICLQGLRDYFGAHTYRRLDKPGSFHTRWSQDGSEVATD